MSSNGARDASIFYGLLTAAAFVSLLLAAFYYLESTTQWLALYAAGMAATFIVEMDSETLRAADSVERLVIAIFWPLTTPFVIGQMVLNGSRRYKR